MLFPIIIIAINDKHYTPAAIRQPIQIVSFCTFVDSVVDFDNMEQIENEAHY